MEELVQPFYWMISTSVLGLVAALYAAENRSRLPLRPSEVRAARCGKIAAWLLLLEWAAIICAAIGESRHSTAIFSILEIPLVGIPLFFGVYGSAWAATLLFSPKLYADNTPRPRRFALALAGVIQVTAVGAVATHVQSERFFAQARDTTSAEVLSDLWQSDWAGNDPVVMAAVAANPATPIEILRQLADYPNEDIGFGLIKNRSTPPDTLERLYAIPEYRIGIARHPYLTAELMHKLANDPDEVVAANLVHNDSLPDAFLRKLEGDPRRGKLAQQALTRRAEKETRRHAPEVIADVSISELITALREGDTRTRGNAAVTLAGFPKNPQALAALITSVTTDPDAEIRRLALTSLFSFHGPQVVGATLSGLKDEDAGVRLAVFDAPAWVLHDAQLTEALRVAIDDEDAQVREAALTQFVSGRAAEIAPVLGRSLHDPKLRRLALSGLEQLGPAAVIALPDLQHVLRGQDPAKCQYPEDWQDRQQAARILENIGAPAVPVLMEVVDDVDDEVATVAQLALMQLGPEAAAAIPTLIQFFEHPHKIGLADRLLAHIGPTAVPAIEAVLRHPNPNVRFAAAASLYSLGVEATDALPTLRALPTDDDPKVREMVLEAIKRIATKQPNNLRWGFKP